VDDSLLMSLAVTCDEQRNAVGPVTPLTHTAPGVCSTRSSPQMNWWTGGHSSGEVYGDAENAGLENAGPNLQGWNRQDKRVWNAKW